MSHFVFKAGFSQLTEEEMDILKLDVSNHEIHVVIKHMGAFKAPGKDSFQAIFYQSQWKHVDESFCKLVFNNFRDHS